jgi:hypothetical protein
MGASRRMSVIHGMNATRYPTDRSLRKLRSQVIRTASFMRNLRSQPASLNNNGKLQILPRDEWRDVIHRSPDRLDAVVMAVAARWYASFGGVSEMDGPVAF